MPGMGNSRKAPWARQLCGAAALLGTFAGANALASPAVDRLFEQCARNLDRSPDEVSIRCRHYLEFGGDDDPARRRQVQAYLNKAERTGAASGWNPVPAKWRHHSEDEAVLVPDLLRREGEYRVDVVRTYASAWEGALLRRAEAIYPAKRRSDCDEQPAGSDGSGAPASDWSCGAFGVLRRAAVASPAALQYYLDWTEAADNPSQPVHSSVRFDSSTLVYLAAINYRERYRVGRQRFDRVYVAQVNLGWAMTPPGASEAGFMRSKIVVFNGDGSVAALFDDHPINAAQ